MLRESCRRFRADFSGGPADAHVAECSACRVWAEAISSLADCGVRLPLPPRLRAGLLAIGRHHDDQQGEPFTVDELTPLPQLPLPQELRRRLSDIPAASRRELPAWITKARYGVAASYLIAALLVTAAGSSLASAQQTATSLSRRMDSSLQSTELKGSRAFDRLGASAQTGLVRLKTSAQSSLGQLVFRWTEVRRNLIDAKEGASPRELGEKDAEQPTQTR